ncbi:MAG TPA: polyphosphate polymerase domain-containing protein [Candidatus Ozemobacteraceae bacterium]|nr:polyphosphate polymerase domain-containing protein [Candidatus Ozemobacteraceae bacterium]
MASDWGRYEERKFLLPPGTAGEIQTRLTRAAVPDKHSGVSGYEVASLYFDTWSGQCASDKREGEFDRYKVRLRAYRSDAAAGWAGFHLELKSRQGNRIGKRRQLLRPEEADGIAREGLGGAAVAALLDGDGERLIPPGLAEAWAARPVLRPAVLVTYRRSAFQLPGLPGLRLTFDRQVAAHPPCWPPEDAGGGRRPFSPVCIFEGKAPLALPRTILQILASHGILETSCSKFLLARDLLDTRIRDVHAAIPLAEGLHP